jgi:hypothetical protein
VTQAVKQAAESRDVLRPAPANFLLKNQYPLLSSTNNGVDESSLAIISTETVRADSSTARRYPDRVLLEFTLDSLGRTKVKVLKRKETKPTFAGGLNAIPDR